jgi:hypothetical protein
LFVHSRILTDYYRNFTFIRTYFIVVQQQHSSSKTTQTERVGVGEAPNYFTFIFLISYLYNNTYYLFRTTTNFFLLWEANRVVRQRVHGELSLSIKISEQEEV